MNNHRKKFTYEISFETIEHSAETVKEALGTDYYNPDYGNDVHAREMIGQLFQDATLHCIMTQLRHMSENKGKKNEDFHKYMQHRIDSYKKIQESIKFVKSEKVL